MQIVAEDYFRAQVSSRATSELIGETVFAVDYLQSSVGMNERTTSWKAEPAIHVCVPTLPLLGGAHHLWLDGKEVPSPNHHPRLSCTVVDLRSAPSVIFKTAWGCMFHYLPLGALEEIAEDLAIKAPSEYRHVIAEQDPFVAQLTKILLSRFEERVPPHALALDTVGLLLATHVIEHYGSLRKSVRPARGGLAPWQKKRAMEILAAHIVGDTSLTYLAEQCGLSRSHFSRAFKQSLGKSVHSWHAEQRMARARDLLLDGRQSIAVVATLLGFSDQSTFSRSFSKAAGMSPNRWRQMNKRRSVSWSDQSSTLG